MGGNKHKNGIVCMFPGCEKTMRTQKFKLHFTKQHLKPGEDYTVEHRRRFEVARDEEYTSDAAAPTHKLEQQQQRLAAVPVQIPTTYQQQVAAVAAPAATGAAGGSTGMTPTFTPSSSSVADVTPVESVAESAAAAVKVQPDAAHSQALLIEEAVNQQAQLLEEQQRLNCLTQQQQSRPAEHRFSDTPTPATTTSHSLSTPSSNKRPASALESASVEVSSAATPTNSISQGQDPSRAVLVQYIEIMDQRFHELIQKMTQVIDGQRELIDMLRRPFSADTAQLLDQTPSLSSPPNDDGSAKKRRKSSSGAEQQAQQQANGAAQRLSITSTSGTTPSSALLSAPTNAAAIFDTNNTKQSNMSDQAVDAFASVEQTLAAVEEHLQVFKQDGLESVVAELSPLEKAKVQVSLAYSVNALLYVFLKTQGVSAKDIRQTHVKQELERVKAFIKKIKDTEELAKGPKLSLDKDASKRMVHSALSSDQVYVDALAAKKTDAEAAEKGDEVKDKATSDKKKGKARAPAAGKASDTKSKRRRKQ